MRAAAPAVALIACGCRSQVSTRKLWVASVYVQSPFELVLYSRAVQARSSAHRT